MTRFRRRIAKLTVLLLLDCCAHVIEQGEGVEIVPNDERLGKRAVIDRDGGRDSPLWIAIEMEAYLSFARGKPDQIRVGDCRMGFVIRGRATDWGQWLHGRAHASKAVTYLRGQLGSPGFEICFLQRHGW